MNIDSRENHSSVLATRWQQSGVFQDNFDQQFGEDLFNLISAQEAVQASDQRKALH
jgi:hypothetical protein